MSLPPGWRCQVYLFIAVASAVALVWRHPLAEIAGQAAAPIGAAFTLVCLATGSLWGRPMWGAWWVWDARLTSVLVLFFLYLGYIALVNAFDDRSRGARAGALLALVGVVNLPIIKFSVDWWNTLHQPASVVRIGGPSIALSMLVPLLVMASAFTLLFCWLLLLRMRTALNQRKIRRCGLMRRRCAAHRRRTRAVPRPVRRCAEARHGEMLPSFPLARQWSSMGGYAAFVWPAYAVAVAVLGGSRLALLARAIGPAQRALERCSVGPIGRAGRADDAQAAAADRARDRHVPARPRRPRWCWSRSTTISCSSTARAIWPKRRSAPDRRMRIGGLVEAQSLRAAADGRGVDFRVTDGEADVAVVYHGVLPDLFREGQGAVAEGKLRRDGVFAASSVLAKHDEKYMPPEVVDALKKAGHWQEGGTQGAVPRDRDDPLTATTAAS